MFQAKLYKKSKTFSVQYIPSENRPVCEIMLKCVVHTDRPQMKMWRMR